MLRSTPVWAERSLLLRILLYRGGIGFFLYNIQSRKKKERNEIRRTKKKPGSHTKTPRVMTREGALVDPDEGALVGPDKDLIHPTDRTQNGRQNWGLRPIWGLAPVLPDF